MCACLVLRRTKCDSAKACLAKLHWLPIRQRITFKICVLTYKLLHGQGPDYLRDFLHYKHNTSNRSLRSTTDQSLLVIPRTKCKTFTTRSFSVAAPTLWNNLPKGIRESNSLLSFKRDLKTHLYKETFGNLHPPVLRGLIAKYVNLLQLSTSPRNVSNTSFHHSCCTLTYIICAYC